MHQQASSQRHSTLQQQLFTHACMPRILSTPSPQTLSQDRGSLYFWTARNLQVCGERGQCKQIATYVLVATQVSRAPFTSQPSGSVSFTACIYCPLLACSGS